MCYNKAISLTYWNQECKKKINIEIEAGEETKVQSQTSTEFIATAGNSQVIINGGCSWQPNNLKGEQVVQICASGHASATDPKQMVLSKDIVRGRLEVEWKGTWQRVCADNLAGYEAEVVCKNMGHSQGIAVINSLPKPYFQQGCFLDTLKFSSSCIGSENNLFDCATATKQSCQNGDLGIICLKGSNLQTKESRLITA